MRVAILAAALLVSTGASGQSPAHTGSVMLRQCEAALANPPRAADGHDIGFCQGFTVGIVQGIYMGEIASGARRALICPPSGAEVGQFIRIAVKYLRDNPHELHEPATGLFARAFALAFPCPR